MGAAMGEAITWLTRGTWYLAHKTFQLAAWIEKHERPEPFTPTQLATVVDLAERRGV